MLNASTNLQAHDAKHGDAAATTIGNGHALVDYEEDESHEHTMPDDDEQQTAQTSTTDNHEHCETEEESCEQNESDAMTTSITEHVDDHSQSMNSETALHQSERTAELPTAVVSNTDQAETGTSPLSATPATTADDDVDASRKTPLAATVAADDQSLAEAQVQEVMQTVTPIAPVVVPTPHAPVMRADGQDMSIIERHIEESVAIVVEKARNGTLDFPEHYIRASSPLSMKAQAALASRQAQAAQAAAAQQQQHQQHHRQHQQAPQAAHQQHHNQSHSVSVRPDHAHHRISEAPAAATPATAITSTTASTTTIATATGATAVAGQRANHESTVEPVPAAATTAAATDDESARLPVAVLATAATDGELQRNAAARYAGGRRLPATAGDDHVGRVAVGALRRAHCAVPPASATAAVATGEYLCSCFASFGFSRINP